MGNLVDFAKSELALIGGDDEMQRMMNDGIVRIVEVFANEGHSGFSARYAVNFIEKLLRFEPLTPLTGEPAEWSQPMDGMWQNKRCSHVFKDSEDGPAYDIQGIIWRDPDGACFTNGKSRVEVAFPYTPASEYRDRPADAA